MTYIVEAAPSWSTVAIARLRDRGRCPVCGRASLVATSCTECGADLATAEAVALWNASHSAAVALEARETLRVSIPRRSVTAAAPAAPRPSATVPAPTAVAPPRGNATVQSVLAVAGAGLFAVAAIVFTFFNPDLDDRGVRSLVLFATTAVFLAGARMLHARRLRSSAETVGALGTVFIALDITAIAELTPPTLSGWVLTAIATLIAGGVMGYAGLRFGIRAWFAPAVVALALVPAMFGAAGATPIAALIGWTGTMGAAMALIAVAQRAAAARRASATAEGVALTVVQVIALVISLPQLPAIGASFSATLWTAAAFFALVALVAALSARRIAMPLWSTVSGGTAVGALTLIGAAVPVTAEAGAAWLFASAPAGAAAGLLLATWAPDVRSRSRIAWTTTGALSAMALMALPMLATIAFGAVLTLSGEAGGGWGGVADDRWASLGATVGLVAVAVGFALHARLHATVWSSVVAAWLGAGALLAAVLLPHGMPGLTVAVAVVVAVLTTMVVRTRTRSAILAIPFTIATHAALALGALVAWQSAQIAVWSAPVVVAAAAVVSLGAPRARRWAHVGAGYAYALLATAAGFGLLGLDAVATTSLTTSAGAMVAIAATYARRVPVHAWWTVLAVTSVPFLVGVVQVITVRTGWTALSTGLIFLLALTLLMTRRAGLVPVLRAVCAAVLVPALAVVAVCLGAWLLPMSGSPVVLPIIAVIVVCALPIATRVRAAFVGRDMSGGDAERLRLAIESSSLLTAAIAVALALGREAAGLPTAILVLVILAVGIGAAAATVRRRFLWWFAAAAGTGALWCAWSLAGVEVVEPYTVPPALAAATVGAALTWRRRNARALFAVGMAVAVTPSVVLLAIAGGTWRLWALLAAAVVLCALGARLRDPGPLGALRMPMLATAVVAASAGPVHAARVGLDAEGPGGVVVFTALAFAGLGAVVAGLAGAAAASSVFATPSRRRWLLVPAVVFLAAGTWPAIQRDWTSIWTMWAVMSAGLIAVVAVATTLRRRGVEDAGILPPVWVLFVLSFTTAIVAWSPRDLRVEWFSLPLGAALLVAGALHLGRHPDGARGTLAHWPAGFGGSWALLAPGLVTVLSASIASTFTDPLTWRAILVIVLALVAILVGATARLAAPFVIGVVVLPIENVSAFAVQIGRGIESMPWWITLAVVGAVLLILAVSYERRAGEAEGIAARLRDLR